MTQSPELTELIGLLTKKEKLTAMLAPSFPIDFSKNIDLKLLDILFCEGGCINGPGIASKDSLASRRQRVIKFWETHPSVK